MHHDNQLCTEKWDGHYSSFIAVLYALHSVTNMQELFCMNLVICSSAPLVTMNNSVRNFSAMNPDYFKNMWEKSMTKPLGKPYCANGIDTLHCQWKELECKGGTNVSPWYVYCTSCGWQKGASWDKEMFSSEEIKPVTLSIVELCVALIN